MKPLTAWMIILGSLVVGAVAGNLLVRSAGPVLQLSIACIFLSEAEKAGYIDAKKRTDLIDRAAGATNLSARDRDDIAKLKTQCPKL